MILTDGPWLKDEHGRTLLLRGVNLGANSKLPARPDGSSHLREGFFNHRDVSFVGRPFPLEEADTHFARLKAWGFTFLRFQVTWEAVEHAGPGVYDEAYLDYVRAVLTKAAAHGIDVFIDPHQDAWSRFSGGSGAPGWTFAVVGLDLTRFEATGAATVHQTHGDPFPRMVWLTNYGKLATATMFTLFFGGNDFAPRTLIEGEPAQDFLQRHYIGAMKRLAEHLKGLHNVVGYGTMNEPSAGFIGAGGPGDTPNADFKQGPTPALLQTMVMGAGHAQRVEAWRTDLTGTRRRGVFKADPGEADAWLDGYPPVWRHNGVWGVDDLGEVKMLRPEHFTHVADGERVREVEFYRDYFRPFADAYAAAIRSADPEALLFVEGVPGDAAVCWTPQDAPHIVHAAHWYDVVTLVTKHFLGWLSYDVSSERVVLGRARVRRLFREQIAQIKEVSQRRMNGAPTLIGEVGIPFDLDKKAFRTGDFTKQEAALDASLGALEANLVGYTLWNYNPDNDNARGDAWNGEDLSIYSRDQETGAGGVYDGGRALRAALRPYARACAGEPLHMSFDMARRTFTLTFRHNPRVDAPSEIFVPAFQYPGGFEAAASDGWLEADPERQTLTYHHSEARAVHTIRIRDPRVAARRRRVRGVARAVTVLGAATLGTGFTRWLNRRLTRTLWRGP